MYKYTGVKAVSLSPLLPPMISNFDKLEIENYPIIRGVWEDNDGPTKNQSTWLLSKLDLD